MHAPARSSGGYRRTKLAVVLTLLLIAGPALAQNAGDQPAAADKATDKATDKAADKSPEPAPATADKPASPAGTAQPASPGAAPDPAAAPGGAAAAPAAGSAPPDTSAMPVNLRLRRLEQRVQALKERAWRAKARVGMLKEAVLGGGVGATVAIAHKSEMGSSFRLIKLVYALDGTQIFARSDETGDKQLYKQKDLEVLTGPIAPGSHTISVFALYRGHGYGVFKYLTKYRFTVRSSHTFTASEGKSTRIEARAHEKGGPTTPLEDRPAIDFNVSHTKGTTGGN